MLTSTPNERQLRLLCAHKEGESIPSFYLLAPEWLLYPMVALATAATVIASQAVISGAFSITQQAIQMGFAPRMQVRHTSDRQMGQIYLPTINWMLLLAIVALVVGFQNSSNLAAAYGIAVTGTMVITDLLAYFIARHVWGWSPGKAMLGALPFVLIDVAFFSANSLKIADGGWFPLLFGAAVFFVLATWKRGRQILNKRLAADAMDTDSFAKSLDDSLLRLPGTAVYLTPHTERVPQAMLHTLKHFKALHERIVLVSIQGLDVPRCSDSGRVVVQRLSSEFWQVKVFYGFMEHPNLPEALEWCAEAGLVFEPMDTSYFLGRETLVSKVGMEMPLWRGKVFASMFRNAGDAASFFGLPANRVIELGTQVVL